MELNDFIANFAAQFDETDESMFKADTEFRTLDEWSSLTGMSVIALAKTQYGKTITGAELKACVTVEDVFNRADKAMYENKQWLKGQNER